MNIITPMLKEEIKVALRRWAGCPSAVAVEAPPSHGFWNLFGLSDDNPNIPVATECIVDEYAAILEETPVALVAGFVLLLLSALCAVAFGCFCRRSKTPRTPSEKAHKQTLVKKISERQGAVMVMPALNPKDLSAELNSLLNQRAKPSPVDPTVEGKDNKERIKTSPIKPKSATASGAKNDLFTEPLKPRDLVVTEEKEGWIPVPPETKSDTEKESKMRVSPDSDSDRDSSGSTMKSLLKFWSKKTPSSKKERRKTLSHSSRKAERNKSVTAKLNSTTPGHLKKEKISQQKLVKKISKRPGAVRVMPALNPKDLSAKLNSLLNKRAN